MKRGERGRDRERGEEGGLIRGKTETGKNQENNKEFGQRQ